MKSPTCITEESETLIDIILTNNRRHVHSTEVFPMSLNDHDRAARIRKLNHHKESFRVLEKEALCGILEKHAPLITKCVKGRSVAPGSRLN